MNDRSFPDAPILFVDDEEHFLLSIELTLSSNGINHIETCSDSRKVLGLLERRVYALVVLDMNMPHLSGLELLPLIVRAHPDTNVIVITAVNDVENAVRCMREGAFDYVVKPVDGARLVSIVKRGLELADIRSENERLRDSLFREELAHPGAFRAIVTNSPVMRSICRYIEAVAKTSLPLLITGETGTGKELFAQAAHAVSGRTGMFVAVNVAGVDDTFFSDTLFGHKKGAFTGADVERKGLIEQAEGGTLFLDEIGDLSAESQVKLLRLLQEGQYYPLGSDVARQSDARIVVATHRDIGSRNGFRQDLYYRLKAHQIRIPPLRDRKTDIGLLVDHLLAKAAAALGKKKPTVPKELYTLLRNYPFPGNIRELEGMITDAVSTHTSGVMSLESIRNAVGSLTAERTQSNGAVPEGVPAANLLSIPGELPTLKEAEALLIAEALRRSEGNQSIAAELLGISRRALNNRLQRSRDDAGASD